MGDADGELVERVRAGDVDAFRILVERYRPMLRGLLSGSDDLVQETFLQAWVSLDGLREAARFRPWLYGIARNVQRHAQRREPAPAEALADEPDQPTDPYDEWEARWLVERSLADLPPATRAALWLFYYADLSLDEVAGRLAVSPTVVKVRLHRGRGQLRDRLTAAWPERARAHRGMTMTEVRLLRVVLVDHRLLMVLADRDSARILPLWLPMWEARALAGGGDLAGGLLRATGARLLAVRVGQLHEDLMATEVVLGTDRGEQRIRTRLSEGVALAHRLGAPVQVGAELFAARGLEVAGYGSLERTVEAATGGADRWQLRRVDREYTCGTDRSGAYVKATVPAPEGTARLRQVTLADPYRGGLVRMAADVRSPADAGRAGLFLRVLAPAQGHPKAVEQPVPAGDGWTRHRVEAPVPDGAVAIVYGVTLAGPGPVWLTNVELTATRS